MRLCALVAAALAAVAVTAPAAAPPVSPIDVTLLFTNDVNGYIEPCG